eukprot:6212977-Pleurochrysis_carterae.AAC.2
MASQDLLRSFQALVAAGRAQLLEYSCFQDLSLQPLLSARLRQGFADLRIPVEAYTATQAHRGLTWSYPEQSRASSAQVILHRRAKPAEPRRGRPPDAHAFKHFRS